MFWFLVALVLLIIWLNERSQGKARVDAAFREGVDSGRRTLKDEIRALRKRGKVDDKALDQVLGAPEPEYVIVDSAEESEGSQAESGPGYKQVEEAVSQSPQPILSTKELEAEKARRTVQNLNTLLYVGSFLIVAATALFVNLTMPAPVKLLGMIAVTIAFYVAGMVLYARSERLRSAAIAFVGTGLAILPFVGFALTMLGGLSNELAWLITSIVGLAAYGLAAVRLQSELVSYITMAFVLSLALSAVSTLGLGVIWYFIVVIGVSLLCNTIHFLRPSLLPAIFAKPLRDTGQAATPIVLAASLFTMQDMDMWMYVVLFAVSTVHYLVIWLETRADLYELIVRVLAHCTVLLAVVDAVRGVETSRALVVFGVWWLLLALAQVVYSLVRVRTNDEESLQRETTYLVISVGLMISAITFWLGAEHSSYWIAGNFGLVGAICIAIAYRLRQAPWLYGTLAASVALPFVIGRGIIEPAVGYEVIAGVFAAFGAIALVTLDQVKSAQRSRHLQLVVTVAAALYTVLVALSGLYTGDSLAIAWTMMAAAALAIALSYLVSLLEVELAGAIAGIISIASWIYWLLPDTRWQLIATVVSAVAALTIGALAHHYAKQTERRDILAVLAATVLAGLMLALGSSDAAVVRTAVLLLLAAGIGMMALRIVISKQENVLSGMALCGYIAYPVLALPLALQLGDGWPVLVTFILSGVLWIGSYIEKQPGLLLIGNITFFTGLLALWSWLDFNTQWTLYGVTWIAATVYYLVYWYSYGQQDRSRQMISFASVMTVLILSACYGLFLTQTTWVVASVGSLLAVAGIVAIQGYLDEKRDYIEIAVYLATLGAQRIVAVLLPEANIVFYAHWWAIVVFLVALWRREYMNRMVIALAFVTGSTGLYALGGESGYSLFFLIEHLAILVVGAILRAQWAMWWGIVSVVVAILYFLRDFTVLALLFLGFLLILFVVWRLLKVNKK